MTSGTRVTRLGPLRWPVRHVTALLVATAMVWIIWGPIRKGIWVDLDVYTMGGRAIADGQVLYGPTIHDLPFTYPPFAAVLFVPLTWIGPTAARYTVTVLSLAAYVTAGSLVASRLRLPVRVAAPILVLGLSLEPFLRTVLLGQINTVLMLAVVFDVLMARRRGALGPGWLVGLAAGIKLTPGVFVLYFILRRDWPAVLRVAAGFAVSIIIGFVVAPAASHGYWLSGGFAHLGKWGDAAMLGSDNQSLYAGLLRVMATLSPPPLSAALLGVVGLVLGVLAARQALAQGDEVAALVSVAVGGLLASPVSWTHHWVWILPGLLVLAARGRWVWTMALGALFWVGPMWLIGPRELRELDFGPTKRVISLAYILGGIVWLAVVSRRAGVRGLADVDQGGSPELTGGLTPGAVVRLAEVPAPSHRQ